MPASRTDLHAAVLDWYEQYGRVLAFRGTTDPWSILVSEVMAQQTQATRAAEAWTGFMATYPTPAALASASPAAVLRAWRGLGYNRRALALRDAARLIVEEHGGEVPGDLDTLLTLPGVGPYTARAVAALAFGRLLGPVDTNVRRVLGRAFFDVPPRARDLQVVADSLVPSDAPGTWAHALMDVGAQLCLPRDPHCAGCPLADVCRFARSSRSVPVAPTSSRAAPRSKPFSSTARWLRGRIVDQLRDAPDRAWVTFDRPIGAHDVELVVAELERLAREGLLELQPGGAAAARLVT